MRRESFDRLRSIAAGPRQRKMSDGEVISTQVQPVSLYTR